MQNNKLQADRLQDILQLSRQAVAIKMIRNDQDLEQYPVEAYDQEKKCRYCQAVMRASHGEKVLLTADNLTCAAGAAAFGLKGLHPKLASGEAHYNVKTFGALEAAHKIMSEMPRLTPGDYVYILISPLENAEFKPDVILVEANPETLMWVALASIYTSGERLQFSTSVVQANCVDATVVPLISGKINATLGCTGCREATDIEANEGLIGIPYPLLSETIDNLALLTDVIVKNKKKSLFNRFNNVE